MPRNVRNFWVEGRIDGRATEIEGGPTSRTGGMAFTVYIREKGCVKSALRITCENAGDQNRIWVESCEDEERLGRSGRKEVYKLFVER